MNFRDIKFWLLAVCIAGLSLACSRDQAPVTDEQRAEAMLKENSSGLLQCDELRIAADKTLKEVFELMEKGEWTEADKLHKTKAGPDTRKFVECNEREKAVVFKKMKDAGIPDAAFENAYRSWIEERVAASKNTAAPTTVENR